MLFLFFLLNTLFVSTNAVCGSCIQNNTLIISVSTVSGEIVPIDSFYCNGTEQCNYAICNALSLSDVSGVLIKTATEIDNKIVKKYYDNNDISSSQCLYTQVFLIGVDNKLKYVPNTGTSCNGALICFTNICDMLAYKNVTYILVESAGPWLVY